MGSLQFPNMGMGLRLAALGRRSSAMNCGCRWKWRMIIAVYLLYIKQLERRSLIKKYKYTAMIILHFHLQPHFIYELFRIYTLHHFTPHRKIWTQQIDLAPNVWLHSSVGRASHRYRGGHGFESRWSPDFFQASSFQLLKLKIYCDDHSSLSWYQDLMHA